MKHLLISFFAAPFIFIASHSQTELHADEITHCYYCDNILSYSPSHHWLYSISEYPNSITIDDGSVWQIDFRQADLLRNWLPNDSIVITQNRDWFSSYDYHIINKNLGTSIPANLSLGPILDNPYSRYIVFVDRFNRVVMLSDNSRWSISIFDEQLLNQWALNDSIIIGENSGWDFAHPYILINVNMNHSIRVKQL